MLGGPGNTGALDTNCDGNKVPLDALEVSGNSCVWPFVKRELGAEGSEGLETEAPVSDALVFEVPTASRELELTGVVESGASMLALPFVFFGEGGRAVVSSSSSEESRQMISGDVDTSGK